MDWIIKNIKEIKTVLFYIICWGSAIVFLRIGAIHIDLSNPEKINYIFLLSIAIGLMFLLLPFFKKVKFGNVELEREIEQTKKEVGELKTELRQQVAMLSTNINTIGNLNNHININLPGTQEIKDEISTIKQNTGDKKKEVEEIKDELILPDEDKIMALAKTRIRIEYLLRKKLEKRLKVGTASKDIKFYSLNQLTKEFIREFPQYNYLDRSFDYIMRVCNAAIHAQQIGERQIDEVLQLGANLIAVLDDLIKTE